MDEAPSLGKALWSKRQAQEEVLEKLTAYADRLIRQFNPGVRSSPLPKFMLTSDLYWDFLGSSGLNDWTEKPPIRKREFSRFLKASGFQIGRRRGGLSAVLGVFRFLSISGG